MMENSNKLKKKLRITFDKMPVLLQRTIISARWLINPVQFYKKIYKLNYYFNNSRLITEDEKKVWVKSFKKNLMTSPQNIEIVKSFTNSKIQLIKKSNINFENDKLIVVCVVKNDLERMKMFYDHYRNIGVSQFVILDNNSDDGTFEWLLEQSDSDIYLVKDKFYSKRKYGWINKILSIYGFDRWYLYVDSDELFVYEGIETKGIQGIIKYAERKKLTRISTIMVDMYSIEGIFKTNTSKENIINRYKYFDRDSYVTSKNYKGLVVRGGPRKRVMAENLEWKGPVLIKHPLFKFKKGEIFESAHYIFPFQTTSFIGGALLHYKFLTSDLDRYKKIAKEGNFSEGSKEYKTYIKSYQKNKNLNFMYEGSVEYKDSSSLKFIKEIKKLDL